MADITENDSQKLAAFQLFLSAAPFMRAVMKDIADERYKQLEKWGVQRHANPGLWLSILGEEFGEVAEAAGPLMGLGTGKPTDAADLYTELIQVAAVAVAWAEQIAEERRGENGTGQRKQPSQHSGGAEGKEAGQ